MMATTFHHILIADDDTEHANVRNSNSDVAVQRLPIETTTDEIYNQNNNSSNSINNNNNNNNNNPETTTSSEIEVVDNASEYIITKDDIKNNLNDKEEDSTLFFSSSSSPPLDEINNNDNEQQQPIITWLSPQINDYLFPPTVPHPLQLLRKENIAIPACYLVVGLLQGFSGPFINVYPLDLAATEAQQSTISSLRGLPASFKLAFGFLSDNVILFGYRRKSYMMVGWCLASFSMFLLMMGSDLEFDVANDGERIPREGAPSVAFLSLCVLLFGTGFWFADVMADSIVAEKARLEPEDTRGHLQSTCYACRFFGLMIAAPVSSVIYSAVGPKPVVMIMGLLPLGMIPLVVVFWETKNAVLRSTSEQCQEIWMTVCSRSVWQPMGFVYLYNLLQVGNAAWREFLKTALGFTANQLNALLIIANVLLYVGIMAYKYYFIKYSWRSVYIWTTLLNGFFSALQILLIQGITFGISNFWFALGDDVFADIVYGIQFLPTFIMMVQLCPTGSEGASYAMFTTVNNSAYNISDAIGTMLLGIWDVSKTALESGDLTGMTNLTILTTILQTSAIVFVGLLPKTKQDLMALSQTSRGSSKIGGFIFLSITLFSVLYAIVVGFLNIMAPGWMGES